MTTSKDQPTSWHPDNTCTVCGSWAWPGSLCRECKEYKRKVEEARKRRARRIAFGDERP